MTEFQPEVPTRYGGRTVGGDVSPADPALVLAATDSGGVFRSTDSGAHWSHVDSLVPFRMEDIKFAPNNASVVLATTARTGDTANKGGIWRSTNAGVTWTRAAISGTTCPGDNGDFDAWGIAFEQSSTNVYVGTNCGLMVSANQGATFTRTAGSKILSVTARTGGQVDGCATGGHVRYANSGGTLTLVSGPTPIPGGTGGTGQGCSEGYNGATTHNVATAPQEANVVFAMSPGSSTSLCGGSVATPKSVQFLMESDDAGATWTQVGASCPARQPWVYTRQVHDGNANHFAIYFSGGLDVSRGTCTANVAGSRCTGLPLGSANVGQGHADPAGLAFTTDGTDCATFKYGDGSFEDSGDCGANFAMAAGSGVSGGGFNALQVYELKGQIHPDHTDLWFGTQDNSIYASSDNGATWPTNVCCEGYDFQALRSTASDAGQRLTYMTCGACVCGFGTLTPGASRTMNVEVAVLEDTTGVLHNSARASSDTFDPNNDNNLTHSDTTVLVRADLSAATVASPKPVIAGETLTWRTTVVNHGPSNATGVTLAITLPAGVTFTKATVTGSSATCGLLTPTSVGCALGTMASGASVDVYIDVLVAASVPAGTSLSATAVVSATSPDPVAGNNTAADASTVSTKADLKVVLTSDADVYKPSTVIHYTITVTNAGPSDAVNVVATQLLPPAKSGFYVSNDAGCPAPAGTTFTCNLDTLAVGGTRIIQVNFLIRGNKGTITSTASVASGTPDPNTANNTSIRNVTVK